jgi:hypothetical protein
VALPLGAIAFYLYDSVLLLHDNEMLFVRRRRDWHAVDGGDLVLLGKRVCMPAPLMPWAPVLRAWWLTRAEAVRATEDAGLPAQYLRALQPLQIACTLLLVLLLVALPAASIGFGSATMMLGVFLAYYVTLIAAVLVLFARRQRLGLDARACWGVTLDVVACAPFGVNLVRRLTLRQRLSGDALGQAAALLPAPEHARVLARVKRRIESRQSTEEN